MLPLRFAGSRTSAPGVKPRRKKMGEEAESASDTELEAELQRLQTRITEVRLWCRGLEEQLAQLAMERPREL
jgi:hypothetical protein